MDNKKLCGQIIGVLVVIFLAFFLLFKFRVISFVSTELPRFLLLNNHELGLKVGDTYQMKFQFYDDVYDKRVTWSSSDDSVATVSDNGTIHAKKNGKVTIRATSRINELIDECTVLITNYDQAVETIQFNTEKINLLVGSKYELGYIVLPTWATTHSLSFVSSDSKVVKVDNNGLITALRSGKALITASFNGKDLASVTVEVFNRAGKFTKIVREDDINLVPGGTYIIPVTSDRATLSSSDCSVVKISQDGVITALKNGISYVKINYLDGSDLAIKVLVSDVKTNISNISIEQEEITIPLGKSLRLDTTITPIDATNHSLTWQSMDEKVATVDQLGYVTPLSVGKTWIKAISADGGYSDSVLVTIVDKGIILPQTLSISSKKVDLVVGQTFNIVYDISPSNSSYQKIRCTSSNSSVAVCVDGLIMAKQKGDAIINVETVNQLTQTINVHVEEIPVTGINLNMTTNSLKVGSTLSVVAAIVPNDASYRQVVWSSSDDSIATISTNGIITGLKPGKVLITATSQDGLKKAMLILEVIK